MRSNCYICLDVWSNKPTGDSDQVGRAVLLSRVKGSEDKGPPSTQSTELTTSEDILAHTVEDADGRYIKSGYAVPSHLHDTAVLSAVSHQGFVEQLRAKDAVSAAAFEDVSSVRDSQVGL